MYSVNINNAICTQMKIDDNLYELPYRIHTVVALSEFLVFHCFPTIIDSKEMQSDFESQGRYSLFCINKNTKNQMWKMKNAEAVFAEIPENKKEIDFISKEHYLNYMNKFKGKEILSVYIGEFRKIVNVTNGEILSSMEIR